MTLLVLGGTEEARRLAHALADRGTDAILSLSGAVRAPSDQRLPTRTGGFGGDAGFEDWLERHAPRAVIDATHPFAARITARTTRICAENGVPYLRLERPGWIAGAGDRWEWAATLAEIRVRPEDRVFLATGRGSLAAAASLAHATLFLRVIDPPEGPFPHPRGDYVVARPPFTSAAERETFARLAITRLVVKDAGGAGGRAKLDAARDLGLPVTVLRRPPAPDCARVATVAAALDWIDGT